MKWHGIDITHDLAKIEYTKEIISQCTLAPMALAVQAVGEILVIWGSPHLILCLPLLEKVRGFHRLNFLYEAKRGEKQN